MIIDVPFRSRILQLTKDESKVLAYLEDHVNVRNNKPVLTHTVQEAKEAHSRYLNDKGQWKEQPYSFLSKTAAIVAVKKHFAL